ncbi:MAG: dihydropteroate synthase [Vampirovibrionia bacterium]
MLLIGENIHVISKKIRNALKDKDAELIKDLAIKQQNAGVHYIDLNIGPAKKTPGTMVWLIDTLSGIVNVPLSLDTTNATEMEEGLKKLNDTSNIILNSTSGDPERLELMMNLAGKYNTKIIGLTMNNISGIPKDPEGRLEIAMEIIEYANEKGVENGNIFLDPLVLPISVAQDQALESLNSIRVFKESFDPPVMTTVGLSNISNGSPKENRGLINRIFLVLAMGCGLDSAIVDAFDEELKHFVKTIETNTATTEKDQLILNLYNMMANFEELEDVTYNKEDIEQVNIYKTAQILLNKNIYAHNYLNI